MAGPLAEWAARPPKLGRVTINGRGVPLDSYGPKHWPASLGTQAPEVTWRLDNALAAELLALPEPCETTVEIVQAEGPTLTVKRVRVVRQTASDDPLEANVVLSNVLWYLPRFTLKRNYNTRTRSGTLTLQESSGVPNAVAPITADLAFAPSSLKAGRPWTNGEILADVLDAIKAALGIQWSDKRRSRGYDAVVPNDVFLLGPSNVALAQTLGRIGACDVRVEPDGSLAVVDAALGAEADLIRSRILYSVEGQGRMTWVAMGHVAPRVVNSLFQRRLEVRCDGWVQPYGGTQTTTPPGKLPILTPVVSVTDLTLPGVVDHVTGRTYTAVQGMFVPIDSWAAAIRALNDAILPQAPSFDRASISRLWLGDGLGLCYVQGDLQDPSKLWAGRVGAVKSDYLSAWQLNPAFVGLCAPGSLQAVRAALVDPATGRRQESPVFMDYCSKPNNRGLNKNPLLAWNVNAIPPDVGQVVGTSKTYDDPSWPNVLVPLDTLLAVRAKVAVEDPLVGILRVTFKPDPAGRYNETVPALVADLPTADLRSVAVNSAQILWSTSGICQTQRIVTVISAVPAGPNSEAALATYPVTAAAALARLGLQSAAVQAAGPPMDLFVNPALAEWRATWADEFREQILSAFTGDGPAGGLSSLTPANAPELQELALANAAVILSVLLDHYEGDAGVGFDPGLAPVGSLRRVDHVVDPEGGLYSVVHCEAVRPTIQPEHLLSAGARKILLGQIGQTLP